MTRPIELEVRKRARQRRAIATVDAIVESAAYILARHGPGGFTTNKVAEKAGVNIASLYQYFPNKEALLFHIVKLTWEKQLARLAPILMRPDPDHARTLRDFIREFFLIEAAEVDLRRALSASAVELRRTSAFRELIARGTELTRSFLEDVLQGRTLEDIDFHVRFVVLLTTSFAERTTDEGTTQADLVRQADLLSDMLIAQFRLGGDGAERPGREVRARSGARQPA